jgi:hypothetical protein
VEAYEKKTPKMTKKRCLDVVEKDLKRMRVQD